MLRFRFYYRAVLTRYGSFYLTYSTPFDKLPELFGNPQNSLCSVTDQIKKALCDIPPSISFSWQKRQSSRVHKKRLNTVPAP